MFDLLSRHLSRSRSHFQPEDDSILPRFRVRTVKWNREIEANLRFFLDLYDIDRKQQKAWSAGPGLAEKREIVLHQHLELVNRIAHAVHRTIAGEPDSFEREIVVSQQTKCFYEAPESSKQVGK